MTLLSCQFSPDGTEHHLTQTLTNIEASASLAQATFSKYELLKKKIFIVQKNH